MPLPLVWLGAAAISALTLNELSTDRKKQQQRRLKYLLPQRIRDLNRHESPVAIYPSELMATEQRVKPVVGALICCGIGGVLDHTGIWVDDDTIIELGGEGLIKPVSLARFTKERSGKNVFIACDSTAKPIASEQAALRAIEQIYQYRNYHLIENNCHQFIWQCFAPNAGKVSTFKSLNRQLAFKFDRVIYWDLLDV
ncbi:hypothetical protein [Thalassotalea hakodatensis]|uniref:hypothetical protein n=1 Tax=Thalassotalea hakodatensis TaxID=3030492 RepID=UPI0025735D62|nr:hypothetical protein [Thalassotalea hakodatensis]